MRPSRCDPFTGAGAQLPGGRGAGVAGNLWPIASDRKTGKGCAIGLWPQPGPVWPDARIAPEQFPRLRRLALALTRLVPVPAAPR